jgi:hypothetical protein
MGTTVVINRALDDVFDYLVELHDADWRSGVEDMRLEGDDPHGLGVRHVEVRTMGRRTVKTAAQVVAYEPGRRWAVQRATGPVRPRVTYEFIAIDNGTTRLRFAFSLGQLIGAGKLAWPLGKLASPIVERVSRKDLARLAAELESTPSNP